jgi:hypothetical protein
MDEARGVAVTVGVDQVHVVEKVRVGEDAAGSPEATTFASDSRKQ